MRSRTHTDINCSDCGRLLGEVERIETGLRLSPIDSPSLLRHNEGRLFCGRCGGRAVFDARMLQPPSAFVMATL
ncbi:MAG: hypothetical protein HYX51_05885 [Chloroflexi bacterium]|nr:hypothetical protein [Chloroflexota bacterium]